MNGFKGQINGVRRRYRRFIGGGGFSVREGLAKSKRRSPNKTRSPNQLNTPMTWLFAALLLDDFSIRRGMLQRALYLAFSIV